MVDPIFMPFLGGEVTRLKMAVDCYNISFLSVCSQRFLLGSLDS
jgi:hypothetical protein